MAVGLGVDGSASNDNSNLMESVRHALMINRLTYDATVTHLDALRWATEGSARCLGRADIGRTGAWTPGRSCAFHAGRVALLRRRRSCLRLSSYAAPIAPTA